MLEFEFVRLWIGLVWMFRSRLVHPISGVNSGMGMGHSVRVFDLGSVLTGLVESEVKNAEFETVPFGGVHNVVVPKKFPYKLKNSGNFSIPCMVGQVMIDKALCDLGASVSLISYSIFQKFRLGE